MEKEKFEIFLGHTKKAFVEVSSELTSNEFQPSETNTFQGNNKLAIIIGITGKSKGRIIFESETASAEKFAIAMNCDDPLDEPNDLYMYIAEFANMVAGRAATYINNEFKDREAWLTPPAIFSGEDLEIISPNIQSEEVYYSSNLGTFKINIGFGG